MTRIPITTGLAALVVAAAAAVYPPGPGRQCEGEPCARVAFVVDHASLGPAWVEACGDREKAGQDGVATMWLAPSRLRDTCQARAFRQDGDYVARSPIRRVDGRDADSAVVLALPSDPMGGIGAQVRDREVISVPAGTPAAEAGLRPGDRIVAVDDRPPMPGEDAELLFSGPAGSIARVDVLRPFGVVELETVRLRIPRSTEIGASSFWTDVE